MRQWDEGEGGIYLIYQRFRAAFGCCFLFLSLSFVHIQLLLPSLVIVIVVACAVSSSPAASSSACRGLGAGMNAVVNVFLNVMRLLRN